MTRLAIRWAAYWTAEPDLAWWKWCEENVILTKYTPNPGPYSTTITPFAREWIDCFRDPTVREVTLVTGSQVSKTQSCLMGLAATINFRPIDCIWADPSREDAKSMSETRWDDIVEHSPVKEQKPDDIFRYKKLEQQFRRCTLTWVGAGSEAKLKSRPVGLLVMNEVEAWDAPGNHAHPAEEAEQRVKAYDGSKIVRNSTPKFEQGYIWQRYLEGDQRHYKVPCPHCAAFIRLEWANVRWDATAKDKEGNWIFERVAASAHHECPECKGRHEDHHKSEMLDRGRWEVTNPGADPKHRSYHLSSLYSPWSSTGFGALAVQFLKAKESLLGLRSFINGALAEPWKDQQYVDPVAFPEGNYTLTETWEDERIVLLTADVQLDHFWAVGRGHGDGMSSRLHFAGRLESFDDIATLHRRFGLQANTVALDCGYDRNGDVYRTCARNQWLALRGDAPKPGFYRHPIPAGGTIRKLYSIEERIDAYLGTSQRGICLRYFFVKSVADDILQKLLLRVLGDWQTPSDAPKVWLEQINARRKLAKYNALTGETKFVWTEVLRKWDHLRDAECMQVVLAAMKGFLREVEPGGEETTGAPAEPVDAAMTMAESVANRFAPPRQKRRFVGPRGRKGYARSW